MSRLDVWPIWTDILFVEMWVKISHSLGWKYILPNSTEEESRKYVSYYWAESQERNKAHCAVGPNALDFRDESRERVCLFQVNVPQGCLSIENRWICKKLGQN